MTMPGNLKIDSNVDMQLVDSCNCWSACCFPRRKKHVKGCPSDDKICSKAREVFDTPPEDQVN